MAANVSQVLHQAPPPQGQPKSAVIVQVPQPGQQDMKPVMQRRIQLDGRFDDASSSAKGEPPSKRSAKGVDAPASDNESDISESELVGSGLDFGGDEPPSNSAVMDEEPLNSDDDVSDAEQNVFDVPDLLVCQYEKVNRAKAKWRFSFKDGILQCNGGRREYLLSKITGEADFS